MMNFATFMSNRHNWDDQTKDIEMGGVYSTHDFFLTHKMLQPINVNGKKYAQMVV